MNDLQIVGGADRGRTFCSLQLIPIVLFTFDSTLLRCSSKFSFLWSCIPKCFWKLAWATGMLLKVKGRWDAIDILREKIISWACLDISGLKLIFQWKAHFVILVKSLFKSFVALTILRTIANIEVSYANSFELYWRPSDKSLISIRNKGGPRMDLCVTPPRTSLQDECWPCRTILYFPDFKKSAKIFKRGPPIPFCSYLWMRPLCQTLSNAFEIYKNRPRTS